MGEELLNRSGGGAIAVWGPTGLSFNEKARHLSRSFYSYVFGASEVRVGDAIGSALGEFPVTGDGYMLKMYTLLGDPALKIK